MDHGGHVRRNYDTAPFWDGCDAHELRITRCKDCGTWIHFPKGVCPNCWSDNVAVETVEGGGRVVTFSIPRVADGAEPIITALVALDQAVGVRVLGRLEAKVSDVRIGMAVAVAWRDYHGQPVPEFVPVVAA
jgi:uncharacterized OB-fold protein